MLLFRACFLLNHDNLLVFLGSGAGSPRTAATGDLYCASYAAHPNIYIRLCRAHLTVFAKRQASLPKVRLAWRSDMKQQSWGRCPCVTVIAFGHATNPRRRSKGAQMRPDLRSYAESSSVTPTATRTALSAAVSPLTAGADMSPGGVRRAKDSKFKADGCSTPLGVWGSNGARRTRAGSRSAS